MDFIDLLDLIATPATTVGPEACGDCGTPGCGGSCDNRTAEAELGARCAKCGQEVKERFLFSSTFIGCMC